MKKTFEMSTALDWVPSIRVWPINIHSDLTPKLGLEVIYRANGTALANL